MSSTERREDPFLTFRLIDRENQRVEWSARRSRTPESLRTSALTVYNAIPALPFDPQSEFSVKSWRGRMNRNRIAVSSSSSFASWNLEDTKFVLCHVAQAIDCALPIIKGQITRLLLVVTFDQFQRSLFDKTSSSDERILQVLTITESRTLIIRVLLAIISVHHQRLEIDCYTRRRNRREP